MAVRIEESLLQQIERERIASDHGSSVVAFYAEQIGCAPCTLHRHLRRMRGGIMAGRGGRKKQYDDQHFHAIAKRKEAIGRIGRTRTDIGTTEYAIEQLVREGIIPEDRCPSISRADAWMRENGYREQQAYRAIESQYALQQVQMDFSRSKKFQLKSYDARRGDWRIIVRGEELSYKANNKKLRTWIAAAIDTYSRLWIGRIVPASGESALVGLQFCDWLWARDDDGHPLRYVPEQIQTDQGSFGKAHVTQAAMDALDVDLVQAQSKEAQGKIERRFRSLWQYEAQLAYRFGEGNEVWLSDLNDLLLEYALRDAARKHPYSGSSRRAAFEQSLVTRAPRETDVSVLRLACRVVTRFVNPHGRRISLDGAQYAVPQYARESGRKVPTDGQQIRVYKNLAGEVVGELIGEYAEPFPLRPWAPGDLNDYRAPGEQTYREQIHAELDAEAEATKAQKAAKRAAETSRADDPHVLRHETRTAAVESPFASVGSAPTVAPAPPKPRPREVATEPLRIEETFTRSDGRALVVRRLEAAGLSVRDHADLFAPLLGGTPLDAPVDRSAVEALLSQVLSIYTPVPA